MSTGTTTTYQYYEQTYHSSAQQPGAASSSVPSQQEDGHAGMTQEHSNQALEHGSAVSGMTQEHGHAGKTQPQYSSSDHPGVKEPRLAGEYARCLIRIIQRLFEDPPRRTPDSKSDLQEKMEGSLSDHECVPDWWQEREEIPQALGFISPGEEPKAANNFTVEGGPKSVWRVATELIATFEQNVKNQNDPRFTLCKVYLQDHLWRFVPLCPSPPPPQQRQQQQQAPDEQEVPEEVCSLGICVAHGLGEIWYIVRLVPTESKISWRFDVAQRLNPYFVLTAAATPLGAGGWVFYHYYVLNPYSAVLNSGLIGAFVLWILVQMKIFEATQKALEIGKKRRMERAQQYTADIMKAWLDAIREVERPLSAARAMATTTTRRSDSPASGSFSGPPPAGAVATVAPGAAAAPGSGSPENPSTAPVTAGPVAAAVAAVPLQVRQPKQQDQHETPPPVISPPQPVISPPLRSSTGAFQRKIRR